MISCTYKTSFTQTHLYILLVYQARPLSSPSRKVREDPADVISIHELLATVSNTGAVLGLQIKQGVNIEYSAKLFWRVRDGLA